MMIEMAIGVNLSGGGVLIDVDLVLRFLRRASGGACLVSRCSCLFFGFDVGTCRGKCCPRDRCFCPFFGFCESASLLTRGKCRRLSRHFFPFLDSCESGDLLDHGKFHCLTRHSSFFCVVDDGDHLLDPFAVLWNCHDHRRVRCNPERTLCSGAWND